MYDWGSIIENLLSTYCHKLKSDKRLLSPERYTVNLCKMLSEMGNIRDKLDALTVSIQQTKDEGRLLKLTNTLEMVSWRLFKMYLFEGIVQDTRSVLLLLVCLFFV